MAKKKKNEKGHYILRGGHSNTCTNCFKRHTCKFKPHKMSMKYYTEWCGDFSPDNGKIMRKMFNGNNFMHDETFDFGRKVSTTQQLLAVKDVVDKAIEEASQVGEGKQS